MSKTPTILVFFLNSFSLRSAFISRAECEATDSLLPIRLILAAARLAPLSGTCAWNQVMCWCMVIRPEQTRAQRWHQSSSALPARAGAKDTPPVHDESLFRSDWRQKRELQIHIWSLHSGEDPKQPVKQRLLSWEDTQSSTYLHKTHLQYYSLEWVINHWWLITDVEKCNSSLCLGTIFLCRIVLLWSCAWCSKTLHGSSRLLQASLFFRRPMRNFQVSLEVKM